MDHTYKIFFRGLVIFSLACLSACTQGTTPPSPENEDANKEEDIIPQSEILLEQDNLDFKYCGGTKKLSYSIQDAIPDTELTLIEAEKADWITDITFTKDSINITCGRNNGQERSCPVTLCYGDADTVLLISQEAHRAPAHSEILGTYYVIGDMWDLDRGESYSYLIDEDSMAQDENGNLIYTTVREYCEQFAADYNADPANSEDITAEDVSLKIYDQNYPVHGCFIIEEGHIYFEFGTQYIIAETINGDYSYTFGQEKSIMKVDDRANKNFPRELEIEVTEDQDGTLCLRYYEEYMFTQTSYDGTKRYWIEAPTFFYLSKEEPDFY